MRVVLHWGCPWPIMHCPSPLAASVACPRRVAEELTICKIPYMPSPRLAAQPCSCVSQLACNRMRSSSFVVIVCAVLALLAHHKDLCNAGAEAGMVPEQQHFRAVACSSMGCSHTALLCSGFSATWRNQGGSRPWPAPARLASRLQPAPGGCPSQLGACERCACCAPNVPSSSWIWQCRGAGGGTKGQQ